MSDWAVNHQRDLKATTVKIMYNRQKAADIISKKQQSSSPNDTTIHVGKPCLHAVKNI